MFTRLYLHIPFCRRKCPYCAFVSREGNETEMEEYVDLLLEEMRLARQESSPLRPLDSVYLGGGTPSLLHPQQVAQLLEQAAGLFGLAAAAEITLEANPGTVDYERLAGFRSAGVNRLSLGVQSFDDRMLAVLGRIHTADQALETVAAARRAGFSNIGIDLIHTLPGQTLEMWRSDLEQALKLASEHLSVYGLTVEEGTAFAARYGGNSPQWTDDDLSADMFETADDLLTAAGFEHYEIANYARPGCRARHNSGYWNRDGCLGLGAGAHSLLRSGKYGIRFGNTADPDEYRSEILNGTVPRRDRQVLTRDDALAEFMFLGLRMTDGVAFADFAREFGVEMGDQFPHQLERLAKLGLLTMDKDRVCLTRRGMLLSNQVFAQFLA
jgi:oxygen-independent coproporphyrinogen III oxidase